jgi:hypothetical protein
MFETPGQRDVKEAQARVARLGESKRVRDLDLLERVWIGRQYDARPSFWDKEKPVQERAPCIVHPVARIAGTRLASMVFGESRFPRCAPVSGATAVDGLAINDVEAKALSEFIAALIEETSLRLRCREMLIDGLKVGSACVVVSLRAGMPRVELIPAKWCTPEFDPIDPERVIKLVYQYRYEDPKNERRALWYRREITEKRDREWRGIVARDDGHPPDWETEPTSADIAIEFCPVTWFRNLPDSSCTDEIDGIAIAEGLLDEMEALDLAHSMRHRNALYNGDPTPVITGATPDDVVADKGRDAVPHREGFTTFRPANAAGGAGIRKGPGSILYITNPAGEASLLESSGTGNKVLADDAEALRKLIFEAMNVVVTDPATFGSGDLSARALTMLFRPMIDLADNLREIWGRALRRVLGMLLRLCAGGYAERDGLFVRGIGAVRPILRRFNVPLRRTTEEIALAAPTRMRWVDPPIELTWGPYFELSQQEIQATVGYLTTATGQQPVMSQKTAVTKLAAVANLDDNADAELQRIQTERGAGQSSLREVFGSLGSKPATDTTTATDAPPR